MESSLSLEKYLARIGYAGSLEPTADTLAALQKAHLLHVPYENLDLLAGQERETTLAIGELYEKIVLRHRGGYCFELNGLFAWLLRSLGFSLVEHFGRWLAGESLAVPKRRHRIARVSIAGRQWIADVGVGRRAPLTPLLLEYGLEQMREGVLWRIVRDDRLCTVVQCQGPDGVFTNYYSFDDAPQESVDFTYAHYYYTHSPQSVFRQKTMVHLPTEKGRYSIGTELDPETGLLQRKFNFTKDDGSTSGFFLYTEAQFREILQRCFGIVL